MSEPSVDPLLTVQQAIALLDAAVVAPRRVTCPLAEASGKVLANAIQTDRDYPPFDKSLMDGYALRSADTATRTTLRVAGEIVAGSASALPLAAGTCTAIMTGAPLPEGADAVVAVELVRREGEVVHLSAAVKRGQSVQPRGDNAIAGTIVLAAGRPLTAAALAVCAEVGASQVRVIDRPRVGVLSTGDEVVPFDASLASSQIRNSNSILLKTLLQSLGCEPIDLGHVVDDPAAIAGKLATPGLDAILTAGGMSMGTRDFTPGVLKGMGYEIRISKIRMRPGKPFVFAVYGGGGGEATHAGAFGLQGRSNHPSRAPFIFGLPGNPVSAFVCTLRLASRVLLRLAGRAVPDDAASGQWAAVLQALPANGPREFYQPAILSNGTIRPLAWRGSADVFTLARADVLIVRPAGDGPVPAGASVQYLEIPS